MLGYDTGKDTLKIRNPWGHTGPKGVPVTRGVFEMSLEDFMSTFSNITFEE